MKVKTNIIKQKAEKTGYTIRKLETIAGIKHGTLYNIISGRSNNPSVETLRKLAYVLNCSINDLIFENISDADKNKEEVIWDIELFLECLICIASLAKTKNINIKKNKYLELADEIYIYSLKAKKKEIDKNFANWLLDKLFLS